MTQRLVGRARGTPVTVEFDGERVRAFAGEPLAVALFASGVRVLGRSIKYHRPRAFFCLSGHCGACLMRVDGQPNVRACMASCHDGMVASGQNAFPSSELDVLGAVDWLFPGGMDHHNLLTGSKIVNRVMQKVVRQLSGLGTLPDRREVDLPEVVSREVDVAVVGAGPAGLAAAEAAARAGATTLVVDEQDRPGGSLLADPRYGPAAADLSANNARAAGAEILSSAAALAWYPEDDGGLLAVATPAHLLRLRARRWIYATGGYDVNALFEDNDRPGVFSGRAVGRLLVRHGVLPGKQIVVQGAGAYADALATALGEAGASVTHVHGKVERIQRARGSSWVHAVDLVDADGEVRRLACDCVAVVETPAPASEAARSHGVRVELQPEHGGFVVVVDGDGQTDVPGVYACGDVCGFLGPERAAGHGAKVGAAVVHS